MEEGIKQNRAEIIAAGFLATRKSLWMDSQFWRVINYCTSGTNIDVQIVPTDQLRKRNRNAIQLNRDEFLMVADKHFNVGPYVAFTGLRK